MIKDSEKKIILITGASSGIGLATGKLAASAGHIVYGTSRTEKTAEGIRMLKMDVCADEEVDAAIRRIIAEQGRLDILIGNAGYGIAGSVEDTGIEEAKHQFETNYFGALRVVRAVLPVMRRQGSGSIITVSSVAGILAIPFQASYSATKFALESTMEALRGEVAPLGIKVSLVEPGDTHTGFTEARVLIAGALANKAYSERLNRSVKRMAHDEQHGATSEKVAGVICKVAFSKNPPVRTAVGFDYRLILFLKRLVPDRLLSYVLRMMYAS
jgi:NAD(P)-dependent dehydrogenase (short-subunit alcohol dehydrogenase family)